MINKEDINSEQWKAKRKEIIQRDNFTCCACGAFGKTLNVHHLSYERGKEYWDYPNSNFVTLCSDCHKKLHGHKDGKLKKSISELQQIAIKRDCKIVSPDLHIQVKEGKEYPIIYINGILFKSYSYAYYQSRIRKMLKGKIIVSYDKYSCINIFGRKAKIVSLKSELTMLVKLNIVSDFNYFKFQLNDIIKGDELSVYDALIIEELRFMTDSDEFLLPKILMPLDIFKSDVKFQYKIIISYMLNKGDININENDRNNLCSLIGCTNGVLGTYLKFMKSKGYIIGDNINNKFTLNGDNLRIYYYKHVPMPSYSYIEYYINKNGDMMVNDKEMMKISKDFSFYCSWRTEKNFLFKIGVIEDASKCEYIAERLENGKLKIN